MHLWNCALGGAWKHNPCFCAKTPRLDQTSNSLAHTKIMEKVRASFKLCSDCKIFFLILFQIRLTCTTKVKNQKKKKPKNFSHCFLSKHQRATRLANIIERHTHTQTHTAGYFLRLVCHGKQPTTSCYLSRLISWGTRCKQMEIDAARKSCCHNTLHLEAKR